MDRIIFNYNENGDEEKFLKNLDNFSFFIESLKYKMDRERDDPIILFILKSLEKIPSIKNKKILYNENFVKSFYRIFWHLISKLAIGTQNFYDFIEQIIFQMNRITVKDYVIYDCHSTDKYNCGRAMSIINKYPSQILVYNTDNKGHMDTNTQEMYLSCKNTHNKHNIEDVDNKIIEKHYGRFSKRVVKELSQMKEFKIKMEEKTDGIKFYFLKNKDLITFFLSNDYPLTSPSGTFNDMTISEIDLDWNENSSLRKIVDKLMSKNNFPKHINLLCYLLDF
jgi:hypothetical protein